MNCPKCKSKMKDCGINTDGNLMHRGVFLYTEFQTYECATCNIIVLKYLDEDD
jgi:transposase-like protein